MALSEHYSMTMIHRNALTVPQHALTVFQRSLEYTGPKSWNAIPQVIKEKPSINSFRRHLKRKLLSS